MHALAKGKKSWEKHPKQQFHPMAGAGSGYEHIDVDLDFVSCFFVFKHDP